MIRLYAKTMTGTVARSTMLKMNSNRPQAAFLDYVPDTGTVPSEYQHSYHFTLRILQDRALEDAEADARAQEMKDNAVRDESEATTSSKLTSKAPLTPALAAIAEASAIVTARSAASAAAAAASQSKNALETFQNTPSKAKKPIASVV
jgi:hypothetical protein